MKTTAQFKDVRFMTAADKQKVLALWVKFLEGGLAPRLFSKSLYEHLINHASFIAHFSAGGFIETYFTDPSATQRFLDQFDRSKGCRSVEYGDFGWLDAEDYRDINNAMVDAATAMMPGLRRALRECEIAKARLELGQAERRLKQLLESHDTEPETQRGGLGSRNGGYQLTAAHSPAAHAFINRMPSRLGPWGCVSCIKPTAWRA